MSYAVSCPAGQFIYNDTSSGMSVLSCEPCPKDTFKSIDAGNMADPNFYATECMQCADDGTNGTAGTGNDAEADCIYGV